MYFIYNFKNDYTNVGIREKKRKYKKPTILTMKYKLVAVLSP